MINHSLFFILLDKLKERRKDRTLAKSKNRNIVNMNKTSARDYYKPKELLEQLVIRILTNILIPHYANLSEDQLIFT